MAHPAPGDSPAPSFASHSLTLTPPPPPPPPAPDFRPTSAQDGLWGRNGRGKNVRMLQRLEARLHFRGVQCELLDRVEARQGARTARNQPQEGEGDRKTREGIRQTLLQVAHVSPPSDHPGAHICEVLQVFPCHRAKPASCHSLAMPFMLLARRESPHERAEKRGTPPVADK